MVFIDLHWRTIGVATTVTDEPQQGQQERQGSCELPHKGSNKVKK